MLYMHVNEFTGNVAEQKQKVREISRGGKRSMTWVRNPNEDSQTKKKLSVSEAAAAFLAEATKDLVPTAPRQNPLPDI